MPVRHPKNKAEWTAILAEGKTVRRLRPIASAGGGEGGAREELVVLIGRHTQPLSSSSPTRERAPPVGRILARVEVHAVPLSHL
jgi:hypothetical protein